MDKKKRVIAVTKEMTAIFGICLAYQIFRDIRVYVYDAELYMALSNSFWVDGRFSIANYPWTLRGVSFPLVIAFFIAFLHWLKIEQVWAWRLCSSVLMSVFLYVFPYLMTMKTSEKLNDLWKKRIILLLLIIFFWSGLLIYPLSDFVALFFLVLGMWLMLVVYRKGLRRYFCCVLAGICLYMAYNTRTIYLFPAAVFPLGWLCAVKRPVREKVSAIFWVICGAIAAAIPQVIVNYHHCGLISPKVIAGYGNNPSLFAWQIGVGMQYAEYETYIGDASVFFRAPMVFGDLAGTVLMQENGLTADNLRLQDIVMLFLRYPLDMTGIYMRHLINMLNPLWGEVYVSNLHKNKLVLTLPNYAMLVIGFIYARTIQLPGKVRVLFEHEEWRKKCLVYATILLPCLLILPGAVELRFFFPMYVLLYGFLLFEMGMEGLKQVVKVWKAHPLYCSLLCMVVFAVLLAVWGNTYANLQFSPRLLKLE